jgi:broad specificity phosphatase PhoE
MCHLVDVGWPSELIALRHGQSAANAAFAQPGAHERLDAGVAGPDWAVALTPLGQEQSVRVGAHLATQPPLDAVVTSSYARARETAALVVAELRRRTGQSPPVAVDERLRDRELGVLELRTRAGIRAEFPHEGRRRDEQGDFYYRPPGGESYPDVLVRVRSFLVDCQYGYPDRRVLVVAHDSVVLMLRYVIEELTPEDVMAVDSVRNASLTRWSGRRLVEFNATQHLRSSDL